MTQPQPLTPAQIAAFADLSAKLSETISSVVLGKAEVVRLALVSLFAQGHVLLEDVPGVGKTTLARAIAASVHGQWRRIQFTPDLLPSDVTGVTIFNQASRGFEFHPGPIFANIVIADEINRASPKTQSALLEAMEEHQVTVDGVTYELPPPFMVIATQNPVEHEGTYPLPESQLDRFLMRIGMGYPARAAEIAILETHAKAAPPITRLSPVANADDVATMVALAHAVHVAPSLKGYIVDLAASSRRHPSLALGVSPRAALGLLRAARARAAAAGREYVVPDDIKVLAGPVLEHRLALTPEAQLRGATRPGVLREVLGSVAIPSVR